MRGTSPTSFVNPVRPPLQSHHHSSDSTLRSQPHSKNSSNCLSFHSVAENPVYSDEEAVDNHHQTSTDPETAEVALDDYHEHFRQLVSKIARETEEALVLAAAETKDVVSDDAPSSIDSYRPRIPTTIGYDEFGRPYRPDEPVPILNTYVRRMPTIESMGSREFASSICSRTTMTASVRSSLPLSRPLTRVNTLDSTMGSRRSSRTNYAAAGAEIVLNVARTTEVGELGEKSGRTTDYTSSGSSYPSTTSYHTAASHGSTMSSSFPLSTH
ncbi:hypothetical protein C0992_004252 [Termitomyces sp. T32_za158]|nr:hypothetical protein C0992_004252 [Termitomyces sp. T32_za158]